MMKKSIISILLVISVLSLLTVACSSNPVHGQTRGLVDEMTDSTMIVRIDGSKVKFDLSEASFTNGAVMYGDSVMIDYYGSLDSKRAIALTVQLIIRQGVTVPVGVVDTNKELITREADPEDMKATEEAIEDIRKYLK